MKFRIPLIAAILFNLAVLPAFGQEPAGDYTPAQCPVVGNTNSSIYHVANGRFYRMMLIRNKKGDNRRCFKTEEEALQAGFRKSKR